MGFHLIDGGSETIEACGACEAFDHDNETYQPTGGLCQRHFNAAITRVLDNSEHLA